MNDFELDHKVNEKEHKSEYRPTSHPTRKYPFRKLVLAGGGLRGMAYIGALRALRSLGVMDGVDEILGCSIGAVMALLIVLEYTEAELHDFLLHFKYEDIKDLNFVALLEKWGVDSGAKAEQFLTLLIKRKTGLINPTFKALDDFIRAKAKAEAGAKTAKAKDRAKARGRALRLTVNAVALDEFRVHYFNVEETPDMPVVKAVRASVSLPGIFCPVDWREHYWVDGGLMNNLPLEYWGKQCKRSEILGLRFPTVSSPPTYDGLQTFQKYIFSVWGCVYSTMNDLRARLREEQTYHVIKIPTAGIGTFQFTIPRTKRLHLLHLGEKTVLRYFDNYEERERLRREKELDACCQLQDGLPISSHSRGRERTHRTGSKVGGSDLRRNSI